MKGILMSAATAGLVALLAAPTLAQAQSAAAGAGGTQVAQAADEGSRSSGSWFGFGGGRDSERGSGPEGKAGGWWGHDHHGPGFRSPEEAQARLAGKLAYAESLLKLSEAQKPAWDKFAGAVRSAFEPVAKQVPPPPPPRDAKAPPPPPLPERLEQAETHLTVRLAFVKAVRAALADLYPELTAEQRKVADGLRLHGRPF